jgi:SAM-dependent methyltransferase
MGGEKADRVIELLDLPAGARVLDAGCGKAELLMRIVDRYDATGIGVDVSPYFMREAREKAAALPAAALELHEMRMKEFVAEPQSFDLAICVGAAQLFEDYRGALRALTHLVRPGGLILIGEPYWKREPSQDYLEVLGASRDGYATHAGTVGIGSAENLTLLYATVSNDDEWDHYEGLYMRGVERYAAAHPDDGDVPTMLSRSRTWRDMYLRWGRDTLGFGIYLYRT